MNIYQGDQIIIAVTLTDENGNVITDASEVAISLGNITRTTSDAEYPVTWDDENDCWLFALPQEDTASLPSGMMRMQARVKFEDGTIGNAYVATVFILPSLNTEVM